LIVEKIPLFVLVIITIGIVYFTSENKNQIITHEMVPLDLRIGNAVVSYCQYLSKFVWPTQLAVYYPYPVSLSVWVIFGAGLLLIGISVFVCCMASNAPYLLTGWFWYLCSLLPVIGIIQTGLWPAFADRWAHVPSIGIFLMLIWGVASFFQKIRYRCLVYFTFSMIMLSLLAVVSKKQLQHWENTITLFEHTIAVTDRNPAAHLNLGVAYAEKGFTDKAIYHYNKVLQFTPEKIETINNLANAYYIKGNVARAIALYRSALKIDPHRAETHNNIGFLLSKMNNYNEAIAHYQKAIQLKPNYLKAHQNLGNVLLTKKKFHDAIAHFHQVINQQHMNLSAHINLGRAFSELNRLDDALRHFSIAVQIDPYNAEIKNTLGVLLARKKSYRHAITQFNQVLKIEPNHKIAKTNLNSIIKLLQESERK